MNVKLFERGKKLKYDHLPPFDEFQEEREETSAEYEERLNNFISNHDVIDIKTELKGYNVNGEIKITLIVMYK